MGERILEIDDLKISFRNDHGRFPVVDGISFHVTRGEILGIVGESGCGKSVTALSILRLLPRPAARIESGRITFSGRDILGLKPHEMRKIRGSQIGMIFQEPAAALSPLHRVGDQLTEAVRFHENISTENAWKLASRWLERVGIPAPEERMYSYPFQLSGGMQQRVMIAMALILKPRLLIADEPTTALDVTVAAQIIDLLSNMKKDDMSVLLITHNMGVVWEMCDRVMVMYAGKILETGPVGKVFEEPFHPYTRGLLESIPRISRDMSLVSIPGQVPSPENFGQGCRFYERCAHAFDICLKKDPEMVELGPKHWAACFMAGGV